MTPAELEDLRKRHVVTVIDLEDLRKRQRPYMLLPALIATLGSFLFQFLFLLFPLLFVAGGILGLDRQSPVGGAIVIFVWLLLFSLGGILVHSAFETARRPRLWGAIMLFAAAITATIMILQPPIATLLWLVAGTVVGAGVLVVSFNRMVKRLAGDPPGAALLRGLNSSPTSLISRLSMRPGPLLWQTAILAVKLAGLILLYVAVAVAHATVTIVLPAYGILSGFVWLLLFRPLISTLAVNAVRRFRARLARSAAQLYDLDPRAPVILLRSFRDDSLTVPFTVSPWLKAWGVRRRNLALEESIAEAAFRFGPVGAVQDPASTLHPLGAARHLVTDGNWQDYVALQVTQAAGVILIHNSTPGVRWEEDHIRRTGAMSKMIRVIPPPPPGAANDDLPPLPKAGAPGPASARKMLCLATPEPVGPCMIVAAKADADSYARAMLLALTLVTDPPEGA